MQPDENRVSIAIDDFVSVRFDQLARLLDNLMAAQGDAAGERRVEEAAGRGAENAVKRVHNDFDGLRHGGVVLRFGLITHGPERLNQPRQDGRVARKGRAFEALYVIAFGLVAGLPESLRINQEGADDARVQRFKIQHEYLPIQAWLGIHHIAAGAGEAAVALGHRVGCDKASPMQARQVEEVEGGDRTAMTTRCQTGQPRPLKAEGQQIGLQKNLPH